MSGKSGYPPGKPKLIPVLLAVLPDLLSQASIDQQSCQLIGAYVNELLKCVNFLSSQASHLNPQINMFRWIEPQLPDISLPYISNPPEFTGVVRSRASKVV